MKVAMRVSLAAGMLAAVICSSAPEGAAQTEPLLGCMKPGTGLLRIVAPGERCKGNETPLSFGDFPLLVALRDQVVKLQADVADLKKRVAELEECTVCNPQ